MPRYFTKGGVLEPIKDYDTWFNNLRENVKTSDDVFTPPLVYEEVLKYINEKIIPIDSIEIQRPFYPGGDYQKDAETYNEKSLVIDNPPFSICSEIIDFYTKNNIKFFIFTNGLTIFSYLNRDVHLLCPYAQIKYENGAKINTCFIHNLLPRGVTIGGDLRDRLKNLCKESKTNRKKYSYPDEVLSVAQSLELAKIIKGDHTITNYKSISGLNVNGKQKKVFCKAMLLSNSEMEKLQKIKAECGLIKGKNKVLKQTKNIKNINYAIMFLSVLGATNLFYFYGGNKETITFVAIYSIIPIVLACLSIVEALKIEIANDNDDDDDDTIKFEISERQHKYREAIEN